MAEEVMRREPHPRSLSPRALAIAGWSAFILAGMLFLAIAWNVSALASLATLDAQVAAWLEARGNPALVGFFLALTHLNSTVAITAWSCIFGVVLARMREWYWMLTLSVAVGGVLLVNVLLKHAYERLRPRFDEPLLTLTTYSFPSGHTAGAVAFYGVLAAFLVSRFYDVRRRAACVIGAAAAVALVAFSRLYLGAHYLSDVVAAVCSSTAWLALCLTAGHALVRGRLRPRSIAVGALALAAVFAAVLLPVRDWSQPLEDAIAGMSLAAGVAAFCALNTVATLLFVPAWVFPIVAGAVFGFGWGLVAALAGALSAALAAFLLARHALRRRVERAARRSAAFKSLDQALKKDGWTIVALLRMAPVMPSGAKSYFLGVTRVRLAPYLAASAAGMLPGILLKVYVGSAGRGALSEGGALNWSLFAAGVAATVALAVILGRVVRKKLKV
jgi:uncharacterized membrane protein YdjX (TVP38/TMEM64 family)/membrane-associated phospholipid phosphatase